jgi:hypothetical protein
MQQIILNEQLTLKFEPDHKKVRLVVLQADEELVCRKETIKNLQQFLAEEQAHVFKGRLQLSKNDDVVEVLVKQKSVGTISSITFKNVVDTIHN